jgi:hypothetical protein
MAVVINQVAWDFSNLEIQFELLNKISAVDVRSLGSIGVGTGITEITYKWTIERADMMGSARQSQDETDGICTYESSMSTELYWWQYFEDKAAEAQVAMANLRLNINIVFYKPGIPPRVHLIHRAALTSAEHGFARGSEPLIVPIELKPHRVYQNGIDPLGNRLSA